MNQWIYQHNRWPDFTWDNPLIRSRIVTLKYQQGYLAGRMQSLGFEIQLESSLSGMTQEFLKSFAIEGKHMDPIEVRSSIGRQLGLPYGVTVSKQKDLDAMVEILTDATQNYHKPLTQKRLFSWHAALFPTGFSGMRKIRVGTFRKPSADPMQVVSGPIGHEKIHFQAPSAKEIPSWTKAFLSWFNQPTTIDPLIKAAISHFWFVTLHPFEDGNGRLARNIGEMALARADNSSLRYYSLSSEIEKKKKQYYTILETQQRGSLDITPWLLFFLDCFDKAINNAEGLIGHALFKAKLWQWATQGRLGSRQRKIMTLMLRADFKGFMNTSKYAKLAKCSTDTALRDIQSLNQKCILIKNKAGGRSTSYRLIDPVMLDDLMKDGAP